MWRKSIEKMGSLVDARVVSRVGNDVKFTWITPKTPHLTQVFEKGALLYKHFDVQEVLSWHVGYQNKTIEIEVILKLWQK